MKKPDTMRSHSQMCVLRVDNIHCDGCKGKIRKLLRKIEGVNSTSIDVEQGKVMVTGNVDPAVLIRKLEKSGKHAEIWSSQKGANSNNRGIQFDLVNNQFKSMKMGDGKPQMKGGKDHQIGFQPLGQEKMRGNRDMKDQRKVKFDLPVKKGHGFDGLSGDDFDYEDEDDFDSEDEYFDEEEEEFGYQHNQKKVIPIKGNENGSKNRKVVGKEKKGGGGKGKKGGGGGGFMAMIGKAIGGKKGKGKDGKVGNKAALGGGGGGGKNKGGGNQVHKHGGGEGKIVNKVGGKKGGGGKNGMFSDFEVTNRHNGGGGMGQYQVPAARGLPAPPMMNMNGGGGGGGNGYHPGGNGMGPMMPGNPYQQQQQQQQYMAMMMNQQKMMNASVGGDMYHMAMYGRPQTGYGYLPPTAPPPPSGYHDPYTHMFSDENTSSCSIM